MERLKSIISKYSRWQPYVMYISRIKSQREIDFSNCVENAKALLEGISKQICCEKNQLLEGNESVSKVLSLSFGCLGYPPTDTIRQIGTAIANIGQQIGNFRNEIGTTSHGRTIEELQNRNENINSLTADFLFLSIELVCCFLIEAFETDNPLAPVEPVIEFEDQTEFNVFWDEQFGEFEMGPYSYHACEILFFCDPEAYKTELNSFRQSLDETNN